MIPRLQLFGAPALDDGRGVRALDFERRTQVLVYLALRRAWIGRAELASLLWPEQPSKLAQANVRKALFRLQSLPLAQRMELNGSALRLDVPSDVHDFESALRQEHWDEALDLRGGELLAGFEDLSNEAWSRWLDYERDRLRAAWRSAAQRRLAGDAEPEVALRLAARLLDDDPLDEDALGLTMQWLARAGQPARARQAYREFEARLARELGVAPSAELAALHASIGSAVPAAAPAAAPPDDGFVGRAVEMRRLAALLAEDGCRLLTMTGPGGVGKTRLARRAEQELAARYADGTVFVALEDAATADELAGRLAQALGVPPKGGGDPLDAVIDLLRERRMLLLLDNFEQLVASAAVLERLLADCPQLTVLVTSRVRLALAAEWLFPVDGLPCPDAEDEDHLESFDAARLFLRAARRADPSLDAHAEAAAIVDICRQVDGLPLALELAASWTRVLSCRAIAAELRHGTELLSAVDPAHPPRHASLDVVFEQSWQLLTQAERQALARLSVFRGGFTARAALAIAAAPLPVIAALADKSLLRKDGERLSLHPLVQQLAAARLNATPDRAGVEAAHARYFNDRLHLRRREIELGEREALQQLDQEFENCRAAWRWSASHGDAPALSRAVHALTHYCDHRSRQDEGLQLMREALAARIGVPGVAALLLGKAAHMEYRLDRYEDAMATATRGLALAGADGDGDADARAQCLRVLGTSALRLGRLDAARDWFEQSLALADACSDPRHRSALASSLALVQKQRGDYDAALALSLDALEQQRRLGDVASEALSLNNLAALKIEQQAFEAAGEYLKSALALCETHGLETTRGYVLANLTGVAMKTGQPEAAERYGRRAAEHAQATGNRFVLSFLKMQFARLALGRHDLGVARKELRGGMELAVELGRPPLLTEGVHCFADLLLAQGETACARAVMDFAVEHPDTGALERDELRRAFERLPPREGAALPWPGLTLQELAHRIIVEAAIGHAPLIATLRAGR